MTDPLTKTTPVPSRNGSVRVARVAYRWALALFLLMGAVQIFLAGLGVYSLLGSGPGFEPHRQVGFAISGVALVIVVLALLARAGVRAVVISVLILLLTGVVQSLLAALGDDIAFFGGLHALGGLLAIGLAGYLFGSSRPSAAGPV
jgi:hypothetical protein